MDVSSIIESLGAESIKINSSADFLSNDPLSFPISDIASILPFAKDFIKGLESLSKNALKDNSFIKAIFPTPGKTGHNPFENTNLKTVLGDNSTAGISIGFMAVALIVVNHSLKDISEQQKAIIDFLETDKQSQIKGDINVLNEIMDDLQLSWNNQQWCTNRQLLALNIKRSSEQNILFYKDIIEKILDRKKIITTNISGKLNDVKTKLNYYRLSLYTFAFSSFEDCLLSKNFEEAYLLSLASKIKKYSCNYLNFCDSAINDIKQLSSTSVQARSLQGISAAEKFIGNAFSKKTDKKTSELFLKHSFKTDDAREKLIEDAGKALESLKEDITLPFVNKLNLLNSTHNNSLELVVDGEKIYVI